MQSIAEINTLTYINSELEEHKNGRRREHCLTMSDLALFPA